MSRNPDDVHPLDPVNPVGLEGQEISQPTVSARHESVSSSGNDDDVEVIRVEIEQTRSEMGDTIDAIQDKLSPEHLAQQARDAAVGRAQEVAGEAVGRAQDAATQAADRARAARVSAAQKARENRSSLLALMGPLMSSLVVLAILVRKRQQREEIVEPPPPPARFPFSGSLSRESAARIAPSIERLRDAVSRAQSKAQQRSGQAQAKVGQAAGRARSKAQQASDQARTTSQQVAKQGNKRAARWGKVGGKEAEQARSNARKTSDDVADKTKRARSNASERARNAGDTLSAAVGQIVETSRRFAGRWQRPTPVPPTQTEQIVSAARENQATLVAAVLALTLIVAARILDSKREGRSLDS